MADITKRVPDCGECGERGKKHKKHKKHHKHHKHHNHHDHHEKRCQDHPDEAAIQALNTDLTYWPTDLQQHCLFFQFAMVGDPTLPAQFGALYAQWAAYLATPQPRSVPAAIALTQQTNALCQSVYARQLQPTTNTGSPGATGWLGWLYPSVTAHCIEEGQYFLDALNGVTLTPQQLRNIWLEWNADHAINISHFIDPQQFPQVATATGYHQTFIDEQTRANRQDVGCDCKLAGQAIETGVNFNAFLDSLHTGAGLPTEVLSVLIPLVVTHIKAETVAANQILALLGCRP